MTVLKNGVKGKIVFIIEYDKVAGWINYPIIKNDYQNHNSHFSGLSVWKVCTEELQVETEEDLTGKWTFEWETATNEGDLGFTLYDFGGNELTPFFVVDIFSVQDSSQRVNVFHVIFMSSWSPWNSLITNHFLKRSI